MVRNLFRNCVAAFVLLAVALCAPFSVPAAQNSPGVDVGFYVRAVLPENQQNPNVTYFDLRMQPGAQQTLTIEVVNEGSETLVVDIDAISASTNRNGLIDYRTPDIRDETLQYPFSELTTLHDTMLEVAPGASAPLTFTVQMPTDQYDGVVLGGIALTRRGTEAEQNSGAAIQNLYSYVVGVVLSETDTDVSPDFELLTVEGESINYRPAFVHYIRNKEPAIAKGVDISVTIYTQGSSEPYITETRSGIDMAPNSVMPLAITTPNNQLEAGEYSTVVVMELDGQTWRFETQFIIGQGVADAVNELTPTAQSSSGLPFWVWLLIGFAVLIILLLLIILFKRRKDEEEEEDEVNPEA